MAYKQEGQKSRKIQLTVALSGGDIPLFRFIAEKGFLSYQVVTLDTKVSPQNLPFHLRCDKYAVIHWRKFWTALCWKEKGSRFIWHMAGFKGPPIRFLHPRSFLVDY
jgi:hypothetical protein